MSPSTEPTKHSVLFVCLGNICRSPMADAVFQHQTKIQTKHPLIDAIDSAGTGAWHAGDPPDPRTTATLEKHGLTSYDHHARKVVADDFGRFGWVFAMDRDNLANLRRMRDQAVQRHRARKGGEGARDAEKAAAAKIMLWGDWGGRKGEEVADPYYGADDGFDVAYEQMVRFSKGFLEHLEKEDEKEKGKLS